MPHGKGTVIGTSATDDAAPGWPSSTLRPVRTLRRDPFIAALTRAAKRPTVHPNTIVYRLKRMHEVTRHESFEPEGLLLLALGLKLHRPGSPEASTQRSQLRC